MPETDDNDFYVVEHSEDFVLTDEQFRKLITQKFERNNIMHRLSKEREGRLQCRLEREV